MNSLNILSARVIGAVPGEASSPPPSPSSPEPASKLSTHAHSQPSDLSGHEENYNTNEIRSTRPNVVAADDDEDLTAGNGTAYDLVDEKRPLLSHGYDFRQSSSKPRWWRRIPRWLANALVQSLRWVLATLAAPGYYLISCVCDESGNLRGRHWISRGRRSSATASVRASESRMPVMVPGSYDGVAETGPGRPRKSSASSDSSSAILSSESEADRNSAEAEGGESPAHHTRSKSQASDASEDGGASKQRSIRIKLYNQEGQKRRKARASTSSKGGSRSGRTTPESDALPTATPATLKSPTSPSSSLRMTKYPRAPVPPRPLIPRRTPSYTFPVIASSGIPQKTLILDLDETLIHSMAKGGRMSTGHMVEVKLNAPVGFGGGVANAPRHPILYYVHKRPYCDDFLRKVCQWYNLVAFTASVQEYADPVIDWLEQDRKYFSGRYYRQHCTYRGGNYIKDISSVEPDLSKVMIVDNSPSSYVFHEDNAIPIEGWINDPTDNDLLHLIPLLEGLQYVTDVRALLALRSGEPTG